MKALFLLLLFLSCVGCGKHGQERSILIQYGLEPVSSEPVGGEEWGYEALQKQDSLLKVILPAASKKERKALLQYGMIISEKLAQIGSEEAVSEGLKHCEELEENYSLSEELQWEVKRFKVSFWNEQERYRESLPLLNELLKEHRKREKTAYIIDDLGAIATYFVRLGDVEKALSYYKEAYRLVSDNRLVNLQRVYLAPIMSLSYDLGHYRDVINLCNELGADSVASLVPSAYTILSECYLQLQDADSARFYLDRMEEYFRPGNVIILNCLRAGTYLIEDKEDSVAFYLNRAMEISKARDEKYKFHSMPRIFMSYYSKYAALLLRRGKIRQAGNVFRLIEPLMKEPVSELPRLKEQIEALYRYGTFYQTTGQYKEATDVLVYRDSVLTLYNDKRISIENKNALERFDIQELVYENEIKTLRLIISQRITGTSWAIIVILCVVLFGCIWIILFQRKLYRRLRMAAGAMAPQPASFADVQTAGPQKKLFQLVRKEVESNRLYLNRELTLDDLAKRLNTNRSTLSACINQYARCNFNKWINHYRIGFALERILTSDNLRSLAETSGFKSYNTFVSCFKEHTGCMPSEYVKAHKYNNV